MFCCQIQRGFSPETSTEARQKSGDMNRGLPSNEEWRFLEAGEDLLTLGFNQDQAPTTANPTINGHQQPDTTDEMTTKTLAALKAPDHLFSLIHSLPAGDMLCSFYAELSFDNLLNLSGVNLAWKLDGDINNILWDGPLEEAYREVRSARMGQPVPKICLGRNVSGSSCPGNAASAERMASR